MTKNRQWLTITVMLTIFAIVLAACAAEAPIEDTPAAEASPEALEQEQPEVLNEESPEVSPAAEPLEVPTQFSEVPMLAERVEAGELPPVEERLPEEPFVVGPGVLITEEDLPDWTPGQYGGTLRSAHSVAEWAPDIFMMLNEPLLQAPGIGIENIRPNIVRDFEVSDDNTEFTFEMRKGLKWSDGAPVTTEDILFTYEDVLLNEDLNPAFPTKFRAGGHPNGDPMELEVIDDYTFRLSFSQPYGGFLREITVKGWVGYTDLLLPSHYLKQFHVDHAEPEEYGRLLEEAGFEQEQWHQFFAEKWCQNWDMTNPRCAGHPTLTAWLPVKAGTGLLRWERNPYYFKVDTEGQQLPYIDTIISSQQGDVEAVNLKAITGEVDFLRESTALVNVPLYKENEERASFRTHMLDMHVDPSALFLNYTYDDPAWQEVVGDVRFRKALSLSINRQEIIDSVYFEFASLPETIPSEYNPEEANRLLDEIGMSERDPEGFRRGPDGKTFVIPIETGAHAPDLVPVAELLIEHFRAVGIKTTLRTIDPSLFGERAQANELQALMFWVVQPMWGDATWSDYIPTNLWAPLWETWYATQGGEGEEPPEDVQQLYEAHEGRVRSIPGSPEDLQSKEKIYALHYDNVYILAIAEKVTYPLIAAANMGNIPKSGQAIAANYSGEQLFFQR